MGSGLLQDSIQTSVKEQVSMFHYVIGHNQRFKVTHKYSWDQYPSIYFAKKPLHLKKFLFATGKIRENMI
jgi:hypothetical protein